MENLEAKKIFRKKILKTVSLILLFRFLTHVPMPFIKVSALNSLKENQIIAFMSMFSGGALSGFTLMAVGVNSYITANIVIQLMTHSIESLYRMSKIPGGQKRIKKIQMVFGLIIAFITSIIMTYTFNVNYHMLIKNVWYVYLIIAIMHTFGTGIAMWIGEYIEDNGFGNGVSLLIFVNIVSRVPSIILSQKIGLAKHTLAVENLILGVCVVLLIFIAIIISETSEKRIPLIYAKSLARGGKKARSYFPIKINLSGVMPIIFTTTLLQLISFLAMIKNEKISSFFKTYLNTGSNYYLLLMGFLIFIFAYFYKDLIFNEDEIAEDMQSHAAVIDGIEQGVETSKYLKKVSSDVTLIGAVYLVIVAVVPMLIFKKIGFNMIASTSLMIMTNVSIEFIKKFINEKRLLKFKTL